MMDPLHRRSIGDTALEVTQFGMGGASLGDMRETISEDRASAAVEASHTAGVGYFDTSPWYGNGKSELRFGHVLCTKPRDSFVLSTKVGRVHERPSVVRPWRIPLCRVARYYHTLFCRVSTQASLPDRPGSRIE